MRRVNLLVVSMVACVLCAWGVTGCGGGDDNGNGGKIFKGTVKDRMSRTPLPGKTCRAVDNDTGDPIPGFEFVSEAGGKVTIEDLPGDLVGFHCDAVPGDHIDTYQFNISTTATDEEIWLVDLGTYQMGPALAGLTLDTSKGLVAGSMYWVNAAGEEEPVGCAEVTSSTGGEVRYFGANELPVNTTANDPDNGRDNTHPNNGLFLVANMEPGPVTLSIMVDGQERGSVDTISFGGDQTILISNIYADETLTENPTPAGCE